MKERTDSSRRGLLLVFGLAAVFFVLLALLLLYWPRGGERATDDAGADALYVIPLELKVRSRPDAEAAVAATVHSGDQVTLLGSEGTWARIRTAGAVEGFVERTALERNAEREARLAKNEQILQLPTIAGHMTQKASLYAGPGFFYPVVGDLPARQRIEVRTREQDFYAVSIGGAVVWVDVGSVELSVAGSPEMTVAAGDESSIDLEEEEPLEDERRPFEDFADRWEEIQREREREREPEPTPAPPAPEAAPAVGVYATVPPGGTEPIPIRKPSPRYPTAARRAGVEGPVVIRAIVTRDGRVESAQILKDQPAGLGEAARSAVERWTFRPATYRGRPIDVYYTVTVNFSLRSR